MSDPLRFGVLGCAAIAVHKVIPAIHRSEPCEVVAIASRDADRAAGGDPPVAPGLEVITIPPADPYAVQADAFAAAVRDGAPVPIPPEDAIGTLAVIERILADARRRPR